MVAVVVPLVLLLLVAAYAFMSSKPKNTIGLPDEATQEAPAGSPLGEDHKMSQSASANDRVVV